MTFGQILAVAVGIGVAAVLSRQGRAQLPDTSDPPALVMSIIRPDSDLGRQLGYDLPYRVDATWTNPDPQPSCLCGRTVDP